MARVEQSDSWVASGDEGAVQDKLTEHLKSHKMQVTDRQGGETHAKQGSQLLTRLLGGWFVPRTWIPKRATVKISGVAEGVQVEAHIEESLGFGILDPLFKKKYQSYFEIWMADLKNTLR